jgi:hypothetical protein
MKNKYYLPAVLLLLGGLTMNSCKKEGCMDDKAKNFDSEAKKDDGSCKFEGEIVTWWGKAVSEAAQEGYVEKINVYLDGSLVHSESVTKYWTGAPSCGQSGSYSKKFDLGTNKSKSVSYKGELVFDDGSKETYWSGSITANANTCTALEFPLL